MKDIDVEAHEAGHALASYYYGVPIESVSTYSKDGEAGRLRIDRSAQPRSELEAATIFVAGRMAEKRALGEPEVFNWFDDDDTDTVNACDMVDSIVEHDGADLFETRRLVELRARGLLVTKWHAIEAIAAGLRKSKRLTGDEVVAICRREGVRRLGELSKDEAMAKLTPQGKRNLLGTVGPDGSTMIIKR
jgi:hypothetical protein